MTTRFAFAQVAALALRALCTICQGGTVDPDKFNNAVYICPGRGRVGLVVLSHLSAPPKPAAETSRRNLLFFAVVEASHQFGNVLAGFGPFVGTYNVGNQPGLADFALVHPQGGVAELRQEVVGV